MNSSFDSQDNCILPIHFSFIHKLAYWLVFFPGSKCWVQKVLWGLTQEKSKAGLRKASAMTDPPKHMGGGEGNHGTELMR